MHGISLRFKQTAKPEPWLDQWGVESGSDKGLGGYIRRKSATARAAGGGRTRKRERSEEVALIRALQGPAGGLPDIWVVGQHDDEEQGEQK